MCMSSVNFTFEAGKDYGVGYKSIYISTYGDIEQQLLIPTKTSDFYERIRKNIWFKSSKHWINTYNHETLNYQSGFHIFLKQEHAKAYQGNNYNCLILKVHFRNVVACGLNEAGSYNAKPCVIAREIKIIEIFDKTGKVFKLPPPPRKRKSK